MGKTSNVIIGMALGAGIGVLINYLFGPVREAEFNSQYRSRWDQAIEDGQQAAAEHEAELRRQFAEAKQ